MLASFLAPCTETRDGLVCLFIAPTDCLNDVLRTPTAQRLIDKGAGLYLLRDGVTNVLALDRPAGAFAKAVCVRDLDAPEAA